MNLVKLPNGTYEVSVTWQHMYEKFLESIEHGFPKMGAKEIGLTKDDILTENNIDSFRKTFHYSTAASRLVTDQAFLEFDAPYLPDYFTPAMRSCRLSMVDYNRVCARVRSIRDIDEYGTGLIFEIVATGLKGHDFNKLYDYGVKFRLGYRFIVGNDGKLQDITALDIEYGE